MGMKKMKKLLMKVLLVSAIIGVTEVATYNGIPTQHIASAATTDYSVYTTTDGIPTQH
jgi:hypothetical protein